MSRLLKSREQPLIKVASAAASSLTSVSGLMVRVALLVLAFVPTGEA